MSIELEDIDFRWGYFSLRDIYELKLNDEETCFVILSILDGSQLTQAGITKKLRINKSRSVRLVNSLVSGGQIAFDPSARRYKLTARGHCRIMTHEDKISYEKMNLHVSFFYVMCKTAKMYAEEFNKPIEMPLWYAYGNLQEDKE